MTPFCGGKLMNLEQEIDEEQARNNALTEQIAKWKAIPPPDPDAYDAAERMELQQLEQGKTGSDQRLATLKRQVAASTAQFIIWLGSKLEWGQMIVSAYNEWVHSGVWSTKRARASSRALSRDSG
jgi:hypothetical protein